MKGTGIESHNQKFNSGDLVRVMNIKNNALKNAELQLIEKVSVDQYGADIWSCLGLAAGQIFHVETSVFNPSRGATQ